jgi:hypothetical protein
MTLGSNTRQILWITLAVAFTVRAALIIGSPRVNSVNTDLEINRNTGALVKAGLNLYDPRDGVLLRKMLREQTHSLTFRLTQANWDYVAGSLLPLNLVYFGAIDLVSHHPLWYRFVQALIDSLFSVVVMAFVLRFWPNASRAEALIAGGALGAFSLVMLQWGVHVPADKGTALLLSTGALLAVYSDKRVLWLIVAPLLLGLAVAFKVIAVCLAPLFAALVYRRRNAATSDLALFIALFAVSASIWLVPYLSDIWTLMTDRLRADLTEFPTAASPLTWLSAPDGYLQYPEEVTRRVFYARVASGFVLIAATVVGLVRGTMTAEAATTPVLMFFVTVVLLKGGLDRINIAIVTAILLIGVHHVRARKVAIGYYVGLGLVSAGLGFAGSRSEFRMEALGVAIGVVGLTAFLVALAFRKRERAAEGDFDLRAALRRPSDAPASSDRMWVATCLTVAFLAAASIVVAARPPRAIAHPVPAVRWPQNPFRGIWRLNASRSTFRSREAPRRATMVVVEREDGAITVRAGEIATNRDLARWTTTEYAASYDGREYPIAEAASPLPADEQALDWYNLMSERYNSKDAVKMSLSTTTAARTLALTRATEYIVDFVERDAATRAVTATGTMTTSIYSTRLTIREMRLSPAGSLHENVIVFDIVAR